MNKAIILIALLAVASCGSKKKLTSIKKEDVSVSVEAVKDIEHKESVVKLDTSKEKRTKNETITESVIREIILNERGIIDKIIERSDKTSNIDTYEEFLTAINEIKETLELDKSSVKINGSIDKESLDIDMSRTAKNPIWNWIGGALFVCILLFFGWKVVLKR